MLNKHEEITVAINGPKGHIVVDEDLVESFNAFIGDWWDYEDYPNQLMLHYIEALSELKASDISFSNEKAFRTLATFLLSCNQHVNKMYARPIEENQ